MNHLKPGNLLELLVDVTNQNEKPLYFYVNISLRELLIDKSISYNSFKNHFTFIFPCGTKVNVTFYDADLDIVFTAESLHVKDFLDRIINSESRLDKDVLIEFGISTLAKFTWN